MNLLLDNETTATNEILVERMREARNRLLADCDWTQGADSPADYFVWQAYRQALRDFPATWEPAPTVDFPKIP